MTWFELKKKIEDSTRSYGVDDTVEIDFIDIAARASLFDTEVDPNADAAKASMAVFG